jgi:hypothetical protein
MTNPDFEKVAREPFLFALPKLLNEVKLLRDGGPSRRLR